MGHGDHNRSFFSLVYRDYCESKSFIIYIIILSKLALRPSLRSVPKAKGIEYRVYRRRSIPKWHACCSVCGLWAEIEITPASVQKMKDMITSKTFEEHPKGKGIMAAVGVLLIFLLHFFWPCLCVSAAVCARPRRLVFGVWGGRCSGHPPTLHPALHFFDPGPNTKMGRGGGWFYVGSI